MPARRRPERRDSRAAAGCCRAVALALQAFLQRPHQQRAHSARLSKAHLGLGRMYVDIDLARVKRHEQRNDGMAIARKVISIGGAHDSRDELVAYGPAVDEKVLAERVGS